MKRTVNLIFLTVGCLALLTSCEVDNYAEPDGIIYGKVTDAVTGQELVTIQGGFMVRYYELSWNNNPDPRTIPAKADGTFRNAKMFAGHYRLELVDGPFILPPAQEADIRSGGTGTEVNFTVTPHVSFSNVTIAKTGADEVTCTFRLKVNAEGSVLRDFRIYASDQTRWPGPAAPVQSEFSTIYSVNGVEDQQLVWDLSSQNLKEGDFTVKLKGYVAKNAKVGDYVYPGVYWIRVAARTNNSPIGSYNYTEITELTF